MHGEHPKHAAHTVAECAAQRRRWVATRARNYSLWGGLISFVLFRAGLWYITHAEEFGGAATTNFWMLVNTMFAGLIWASFALIAVVGLFLPSTRRKIIIPLLVHVVFALVSIEPIAHFMGMFLFGQPTCR